MKDTFLALYENFSSAVLLNSQLGEFFKTVVGVRQGFLLSRSLFNLLLEKTMQDPPHVHRTPISIGGRPIRHLQFADDIDRMGGINGEHQDLTNKLVDRAPAYGKEVSTEKSRVMTNNTNSISADISMNKTTRS